MRIPEEIQRHLDTLPETFTGAITINVPPPNPDKPEEWTVEIFHRKKFKHPPRKSP